MVIKLTLPESAEASLREAFGSDLDRAALEALAIEGYRSGRLGLARVGELLGLDNRWATEAWLAGRGVTWNYGADDLAADRETLERLFGDRL